MMEALSRYRLYSRNGKVDRPSPPAISRDHIDDDRALLAGNLWDKLAKIVDLHDES